jgi:hypothetical protein
VSLNIALAIVVLVIVRAVESPVPAIALVLLSKWRIFAVRPRYWLTNIQANLVDLTVSIGAVMLLYSAGTVGSMALTLQVLLTLAYIAWLVYLKPRSSKRAMIAQACTALIVGTTGLFVISFSWPIELVVLSMAFVGYVVARHVLTQYEEDHLQFLSLLFAFLLAQLSWLLYHWVIAYTLPVIDAQIPQTLFIIAAFSFVTYKIYDSYKKHDKVQPAEVVMPILFSVSIVAVLVLFFSSIPKGL